MTHEETRDLLSAWLDGELDEPTARAVQLHLDSCDACQAVAADLRQVVAVATRLPARPPVHNLWPGIEARIRAPQVTPIAPRRRLAPVAWAGLVAAGLLVGVVLGRTVAPAAVAIVPADTAVPARQARATTLNAALLSQSTGVAVGQLEQVLLTQTQQLDTSTVRVLAQNLARIDSAIADAERALEADPSNAYVSRHLAATTKRKVDILRRVAVLTQPRS